MPGLIRKAAREDIPRIAEIFIFTKRMAYRPIFRNDYVSFAQMQVVPLAEELAADVQRLRDMWVYEDEGILKGVLTLREEPQQAEVKELYVDPFFHGEGIGKALMEHAVDRTGGRTLSLLVLEKNEHAIGFYKRMGFEDCLQRQQEPDTPEMLMRMVYRGRA